MCGAFRQRDWCLNGPEVVLICVYIHREGRLGGIKWKSLLGLWCLVEIMGIPLSAVEGQALSTAQRCAHLCRIRCTLGVRTFLPYLPAASCVFFSSSTSGFSSQMYMMPGVPLAIPKHHTHAHYIDPFSVRTSEHTRPSAVCPCLLPVSVSFH